MDNNPCPVCGSPRKFIPAGISKKTSKPYNSFWSCPNNCKEPRPVANGLDGGSGHYYREAIPQAPPPPQNAASESRELRIAKESALSSVSNIMGPQTDPVIAAETMIKAADRLIKYIYAPRTSTIIDQEQTTEDVDSLDFPF